MTAIKNPVQRMLRLLPLCLAALSLLLTSCKEQDDTVEEFPNWQHQNDVFYGRLVADAREFKASGDLHWDLIPSYSKPALGYAYQYYDYVVVEKLEDGEGTTSPLLTDTVEVHYVGKLIPSADKYKADGMVFDPGNYGGVFDPAVATPSKLGVAGLINGFITAVMQMHKGDHWRVYVPYQLGYGTLTSGKIPGGSTLIFDLRLEDFWHKKKGDSN